MLTSATATSIHALCAEPGIHPTVARMRDIILSKAVDGEPTMESDMDEFSPAEVGTHFRAAKKLADKIIVRQIDDTPNFESRAQLLTRATLLMLGKMPTEIEMHATLRAHGISNSEIAELWPDLIATTADAFKRARPGVHAHQVQ